MEAPSKPALSEDFMDVDSDSDDDSNRSASTSASTSAGPAVGNSPFNVSTTSASFRVEEDMEIEDIIAEFDEMDGDEIVGCNIAINVKGVGVFRGEVVEFDDVHGIWCCLVCGQIYRYPLKKLAKARHAFIHERKCLVKAGFSLKAASSVKNSLVDDGKLGERPGSINDGVLMPKDGHRAHENFELKDPAASGVDLQPGELVGFKIESRIITHPLSLSVKQKGEEVSYVHVTQGCRIIKIIYPPSTPPRFHKCNRSRSCLAPLHPPSTVSRGPRWLRVGRRPRRPS